MDENLDHYAEKIDELVGRLDSLIELQHAKNTITITHKQEGGLPGWNIAAVCACFFTMFALIIAMIIVVPELHDLKAWIDHHSSQIAKMQSDVQTLQGQEKH